MKHLRRTVSSSGYTIDQTILIVAIIAILVTLIIITVGWSLINRTSGTKVLAQLRQIEDACTDFYSTYRIWPHQSYTGTVEESKTPLALSGSGVSYNSIMTSRANGNFKNFVPGFSVLNGELKHTFGSRRSNDLTGSRVRIAEKDMTASGIPGKFLVISFDDVPLSEVREADRLIDGTVDLSKGRLRAMLESDCPYTGITDITVATSDSEMVDVCYVANSIN